MSSTGLLLQEPAGSRRVATPLAIGGPQADLELPQPLGQRAAARARGRAVVAARRGRQRGARQWPADRGRSRAGFRRRDRGRRRAAGADARRRGAAAVGVSVARQRDDRAARSQRDAGRGSGLRHPRDPGDRRGYAGRRRTRCGDCHRASQAAAAVVRGAGCGSAGAAHRCTVVGRAGAAGDHARRRAGDSTGQPAPARCRPAAAVSGPANHRSQSSGLSHRAGATRRRARTCVRGPPSR